MPRRRPEPPEKSKAIVASSTAYSGVQKMARAYYPDKSWQRECYRHYSICGEARFGAQFFGHAVSRALLFASASDGTVLTSGPTYDAVNDLFKGPNGQRQVLEAMGLHLTIAGECYLIGRTVDNRDVWEVASVLEVTESTGTWYVDYGGGKIELTAEDVVIRIWRPNPSKHNEADSPFRTMLPILREIEWLTRHVFAQISSRLAGAGILFLPQGITFPPAPGQAGVESLNEADAFMQSLGSAMMEPIEDPGNPSSVVPHVAMVPGDQIDQVKLLNFWSNLDSETKSLRQEAISRFALGMDLPPEQILGMSSNPGTGGGNSNGVSHWGAWQIEEATIKMHVEPMLDLISNAVTVSYLRPVVGEDTTDLLGFSTEKLRLRPDRSKEAFELWDRGVLATHRLLEENGFSEKDLPEEAEFKRWLLVKIASGSATPEQVQAALGALGVPLAVAVETPSAPELMPAPSLVDHPTNPRTPGEESALLAAADALVYRALERAGNRLRQAGVKPPGIPSYETHTMIKVNGNASQLMADAWSCADRVLDGIADPQRIVPMLESYCQGLLVSGTPHSKDRLAKWMVGQ